MVRFKHVFLFLFVFLVYTGLAHAVVFKSNVGNQGTKRFSFTPSGKGHVQLSLIFDAGASDLDLAIGVRDNSGQLTLLAISESTINKFERLEIGVLSGIEYEILVQSFRGSSPFRLYITAALEVISARNEAYIASPAEVDSQVMKMVEQVKKIQAATKRRE